MMHGLIETAGAVGLMLAVHCAMADTGVSFERIAASLSSPDPSPMTAEELCDLLDADPTVSPSSRSFLEDLTASAVVDARSGTRPATLPLVLELLTAGRYLDAVQALLLFDLDTANGMLQYERPMSLTHPLLICDGDKQQPTTRPHLRHPVWAVFFARYLAVHHLAVAEGPDFAAALRSDASASAVRSADVEGVAQAPAWAPPDGPINSYLVYLINMTSEATYHVLLENDTPMHSDPPAPLTRDGVVYCTPPAPAHRLHQTPFSRLVRLSTRPSFRSGTGTATHPFPGIEQAVREAREGDAVVLLGGTYPASLIAAVAPATSADASERSAKARRTAAECCGPSDEFVSANCCSLAGMAPPILTILPRAVSSSQWERVLISGTAADYDLSSEGVRGQCSRTLALVGCERVAVCGLTVTLGDTAVDTTTCDSIVLAGNTVSGAAVGVRVPLDADVDMVRFANTVEGTRDTVTTVGTPLGSAVWIVAGLFLIAFLCFAGFAIWMSEDFSVDLRYEVIWQIAYTLVIDLVVVHGLMCVARGWYLSHSVRSMMAGWERLMFL